jgi:hypothetical protein
LDERFHVCVPSFKHPRPFAGTSFCFALSGGRKAKLPAVRDGMEPSKFRRLSFAPERSAAQGLRLG